MPKSHKDMVAAVFRTAFAQPDPGAASKVWGQVRDQLAASFPKIGPLMDAAKPEVLAFTAFPRLPTRQPATSPQLPDRSQVGFFHQVDALVTSLPSGSATRTRHSKVLPAGTALSTTVTVVGLQKRDVTVRLVTTSSPRSSV